MGKLFHHVFQVIVVALGVCMVLMGGVWILQGLGLAFLEDSFMANDIQWTYNGFALALVGLGQAAWAATRGRYYRSA